MSKKKPKRKSVQQKATRRSAYELAKESGLIGCAKGSPEDLSTNKRYFEGFGESKPDK